MSEYQQTPEYWMRLFQVHSGGTDEFKMGLSALNDPPAYHGGRALPQLIEIGDIERMSSNDRGEPEVARCQVRWLDRDKFWLARLDDPEKGIFAGIEALIEMASTRARMTGTAARTLWRGIFRTYGARRSLDQFAVIESRLGSRLGPYGLDRPVQQLKVLEEDFPGAPASVKNVQTVPLVAGEHTDKGVVLSTGQSFNVGRLRGYYVGDYVVSSTKVVSVKHVTSGTLVLPPPGPITATPFGAGGSETWTYAFCARTLTGGRTLPSYITVDNLPKNSGFSPTNGVTFTVAEYQSDWQDQVEGLDLFVKRGDIDSTEQWHYMDKVGQAFTTGYDDNGDDDHYKSHGPGIPSKSTAIIEGTFTTTSNETVTNAIKKRMFLFAAGYVPFGQLFAHPVGDTSAENPDRMEVSLDGPDFVTPESSAWPFPDPWYTAASGREYTIALGSGARADLIVEGRGSIAANMGGMTEDGRPGTPVIGGAFYQCWRILNEFVLRNDGKGYTSGSFGGAVTWPGSTTIPIINAESFERCQEYYRRKMGTDLGAIGHIYIDDDTTVREFLRRFCVTFDCFFYENQHGQLCCGIIDELADVIDTAWTLRDRMEIVELGVGDLEIRDELVENDINVAHNFHPDMRRWLSPKTRYYDQDSIDRHAGGPRSSSIEHWYTNDPATSAVSANHRLMRLNYAPRYRDVVLHYNPGIDVDISNIALLTSRAIVGADRLHIVMRHRSAVGTRSKAPTVTTRMLDISRFAGLWNPIAQADPLASSNAYAFGSALAKAR